MSNLGNKARSAVIWNTGFNIFRDLVQFITMLILVRILHPESYGEFTLVTSIIGFLAVFAQNNFLLHILQVKDEKDTHYQDHFTASGVLQFSIFIITNIAALVMQAFPTYAPVAPYVHAMSITFLLEWPCELRRKMIERDFDWKRLRLLQAVGLIIGAILAPVMALYGAGTYSLLIPGLSVTLPFIYDLFIREKWRPTWQWSWSDYRDSFRFGITRMGSGLLATGRTLLESSVLTSVIGLAMLGIYGRAIGLSQMFCQKFALQLMYAIYPVLTRISTREGDNSHVGGLVLQIIAWITVPITIMFTELAEPVVHTVYGDKWVQVIPLLSWAMLWGAVSALAHSSYTLLMSIHKVTLCFYSDMIVLAGTALALFTSLNHGLVNYIQILCLIQILIFLAHLVVLMHYKAITIKGISDALIPPLVTGMTVWEGLNVLLQSQGLATPTTFLGAALWGTVFSLLFIVFIRLFFLRSLTNLVQYLPARDIIKRALIIR